MATVIVDIREKKSKVPELLKDLGVKVLFATLPVGDYSPQPGIIVERKTVQDFIKSLKLKRFQRQLYELRDASEKALIIIEGKGLFSAMGMSQNAILHSLALITIGFGIPTIMTTNSFETAKFLKVIAIREKINLDDDRSLFYKRKALTPEDEILRVVEAFPGIGTRRAKSLLEKFKSIKNLVNATPGELLDIRGFGPKRVEKFLEFVIREYHEKE